MIKQDLICPSRSQQTNASVAAFLLEKSLNQAALHTVPQYLSPSCLDYFNALDIGLPLKTTQKLQLVQKAAVCPCNPSGSQAALVANLFLSVIEDAGCSSPK